MQLYGTLIQPEPNTMTHDYQIFLKKVSRLLYKRGCTRRNKTNTPKHICNLMSIANSLVLLEIEPGTYYIPKEYLTSQ